jgi:hypothetical protein
MTVSLSCIAAYLYVGFDRCLADSSEEALVKPSYAYNLSGILLMSALWPLATLLALSRNNRFENRWRAISILIIQAILVAIIYASFYILFRWLRVISTNEVRFWITLVALLIPAHYVIQFVKEVALGLASGLLNNPVEFVRGFIALYANPLRIASTWRSVVSSSGELRHNRWNQHKRRIMMFKSPSLLEQIRRALNEVIMVVSLGMGIPAWIGSYQTSLQNGLNDGDAVYVANQSVRFARYLRSGT